MHLLYLHVSAYLHENVSEYVCVRVRMFDSCG